LHLTCPYGRNDHHKIEAMFKAFARSFSAAAAIDVRSADEIPSSKGVL
jgi:imidazoleglycerol-phosphate dehydratase